MLDNFYITVFNFYKKRLGKRSITLALSYINFLELSLLLVLCAFFKAFAYQMKSGVISSTKFWVLFFIAAVVIVFKNWMRYNGKKRNVLNAKLKTPKSIVITWVLPFAALALGIILLKVY